MGNTTLEIINFSETRRGDLLIVPDLTANTDLAVCEILDVYADNFEAKGITGLIPKPKGQVVRINSKSHPLKIAVFKSR